MHETPLVVKNYHTQRYNNKNKKNKNVNSDMTERSFGENILKLF